MHTLNAATIHVIVGTLLSAFVLSCTANQTQVRSMGNALQDSRISEHSLSVPEVAERVLLSIELEVNNGSVSWLLTDPSGALREEGESRQGDTVKRELHFDSREGTWNLRLAFEDMSGAYDFSLRAQW